MIYTLISLYFLILINIALQDFYTKYIEAYKFYSMIILSTILYYLFFGYIIGIGILLIYFFIILTLDIIENYKGVIKFIGKDWMIGTTGIYDYFIYIYVCLNIFSLIIQNNLSLKIILFLLGIFLITGTISTILYKIHKNKIKQLIVEYNIEDINSLDKYLEQGYLKKIKINKKLLDLNEKLNNVYIKYENSVPLFLYGNMFFILVTILNLYLL